MIPSKLVEAVAIFVFAAAAMGQLPRVIQAVRVAQLQVLKASQSSHWGKPMLLTIHK